MSKASNSRPLKTGCKSIMSNFHKKKKKFPRCFISSIFHIALDFTKADAQVLLIFTLEFLYWGLVVNIKDLLFIPYVIISVDVQLFAESLFRFLQIVYLTAYSLH